MEPDRLLKAVWAVLEIVEGALPSPVGNYNSEWSPNEKAAIAELRAAAEELDDYVPDYKY